MGGLISLRSARKAIRIRRQAAGRGRKQVWQKRSFPQRLRDQAVCPIGNVSAVYWTLKSCEIWQDRFAPAADRAARSAGSLPAASRYPSCARQARDRSLRTPSILGAWIYSNVKLRPVSEFGHALLRKPHSAAHSQSMFGCKARRPCKRRGYCHGTAEIQDWRGTTALFDTYDYPSPSFPPQALLRLPPTLPPQRTGRFPLLI
jgi:hypothetical protein